MNKVVMLINIYLIHHLLKEHIIFTQVITIEKHIISSLELPIRLVDYVIGLFPQLATRNSVKKAIKRNEIIHNGVVANTGTFLSAGDVIELVDLEHKSPKYFDLDIEVVYQDDYFVVVNKPPGLVVNGNQFQTLENALVDRIDMSKQLDALKWAKAVHRLDAATRGLIVLAKSMRAHRGLAKLFEERKIKKTYHAVVVGTPEEKSGIISELIDDQSAETEFEVINSIKSPRNESLSLVHLFPKTGRTHQLRKHCAFIGHPIVGDVLYGVEGRTLLHKGLFLAATALEFNHPITNEEFRVTLPVPKKFEKYLAKEEARSLNH